MKKNMGTADRIVRILLVILLIYLYGSGTVEGTLGTVVLILSGIFVLTSIFSFCPIYAIVGLNTCAARDKK